MRMNWCPRDSSASCVRSPTREGGPHPATTRVEEIGGQPFRRMPAVRTMRVLSLTVGRELAERLLNCGPRRACSSCPGIRTIRSVRHRIMDKEIAFLQSHSHQIHGSKRYARSWKRPALRQAFARARAEGQNNGFFPGFGWLHFRDKGRKKC